MINDVFKTLLSLSISGSIIALVLFALKPLIHNKFNKTWQFYIWIVVVARMIIPYAPPINIVEELSKFAYQYEAVTEIQANIESVSPTQDELYDIINNEIDNQQINIYAPHVLNVEQKLSGFLQQILPYLGLMWLIICIVLFVRKLISYYSFIRLVKKNSKVITDDTILEQYKDTCQMMSIKQPPHLYSNNVVLSPMCIGFFKHSIVLPENQLDDLTHLHYIFMHELTHYKRLDIYYKWLVQIVICIHWFNPIAYFMSKEVNKYCELSCDEVVIKKLDTAQQKTYGDTLLRSLELGGYYSHAVVSLTLTENTKLMKERLSAIMNFTHKSKITVCLSWLLTIVLSTSAMFTVVYAKSAPNETQAIRNVVNSQITPETETIRNTVSSAVNLDEILKDMPTIQNNSLYATGYQSNWAVATSIDGSTYKEQLNEKIKWIENIYNDKKEKIAIVETVSSENELTNLVGAQYMVENSSIYKKIISNNTSFSLTPNMENWFSKTSKNKTGYERSIFYIDKSSTLTLKAKYELTQGTMAIMILSPDLKTVYRSEPSKQFNDTITIPLSEGLWSIVTIAEYEKRNLMGTKNIQGDIVYSSDTNKLNKGTK